MNKNVANASHKLEVVLDSYYARDLGVTDALLVANTQALIGLAELQQTANEIALEQLSSSHGWEPVGGKMSKFSELTKKVRGDQ